MSSDLVASSVTTFIHQSILQLCNDQISYTESLQVLGVLSLTIDDHEQEVIIKINNTLKRTDLLTSSLSEKILVARRNSQSCLGGTETQDLTDRPGIKRERIENETDVIQEEIISSLKKGDKCFDKLMENDVNGNNMSKLRDRKQRFPVRLNRSITIDRRPSDAQSAGDNIALKENGITISPEEEGYDVTADVNDGEETSPNSLDSLNGYHSVSDDENTSLVASESELWSVDEDCQDDKSSLLHSEPEDIEVASTKPFTDMTSSNSSPLYEIIQRSPQSKSGAVCTQVLDMKNKSRLGIKPNLSQPSGSNKPSDLHFKAHGLLGVTEKGTVDMPAAPDDLSEDVKGSSLYKQYMTSSVPLLRQFSLTSSSDALSQRLALQSQLLRNKQNSVQTVGHYGDPHLDQGKRNRAMDVNGSHRNDHSNNQTLLSNLCKRQGDSNVPPIFSLRNILKRDQAYRTDHLNVARQLKLPDLVATNATCYASREPVVNAKREPLNLAQESRSGTQNTDQSGNNDQTGSQDEPLNFTIAALEGAEDNKTKQGQFLIQPMISTASSLSRKRHVMNGTNMAPPGYIEVFSQQPRWNSVMPHNFPFNPLLSNYARLPSSITNRWRSMGETLHHPYYRFNNEAERFQNTALQGNIARDLSMSHLYRKPLPQTSSIPKNLSSKARKQLHNTVRLGQANVLNPSEVDLNGIGVPVSKESPSKGDRGIESEFMLDSMSISASPSETSRKRRRRRVDETLTVAEVAEYLGTLNDSRPGTQPAAAGKDGDCDEVDSDAKVGTMTFQCRYCAKALCDLGAYLAHTVSEHSAYICHECGKIFTTKSSLLRHRPIHTGLRRFSCLICKRAFYRKDKCKAHIRKHLEVEQAGNEFKRFKLDLVTKGKAKKEGRELGPDETALDYCKSAAQNWSNDDSGKKDSSMDPVEWSTTMELDMGKKKELFDLDITADEGIINGHVSPHESHHSCDQDRPASGFEPDDNAELDLSAVHERATESGDNYQLFKRLDDPCINDDVMEPEVVIKPEPDDSPCSNQEV